MSDFSPIITDFWRSYLGRGTVLHSGENFRLAVYPGLDEDSQLMVLRTVDRKTSVVLVPELAERAAIIGAQPISESDFWAGLNKAGIAMHGADNLFYFTNDAREALVTEVSTSGGALLCGHRHVDGLGFTVTVRDDQLGELPPPAVIRE
ncbi:hypothetical protein DE4585_00327 [Mycobacteroides salmoniphilum]|uniref:Uncharacterized protein n=1 Tax=Mycobacteroides salmoniphilum TaxID=404941 RepID=A0A4R8S8F7_9MYCO|nr:hypothetical protein [Mycobacteroides salmoniphilum]TDZ87335.1 hypothetical protein DE4585_00327 [Mycobacteroides salmoniphilum]